MPTVKPLVGSNAGRWNVTVKIYAADGTTLATVYSDADGDNVGANPLPGQRNTGDFGVDNAGNWTCWVVPGDYQVGVRPQGGSETKTPVTVAADVADPTTVLGLVHGVRADGNVPVWNDARQRLEWGTPSAASSAPDLWQVSYWLDYMSNTTPDWTTATTPYPGEGSTIGTPDITVAATHFTCPGGLIEVALNLETSSGNAFPAGASVAVGLAADNGTINFNGQWSGVDSAGGSWSGVGPSVTQTFLLPPSDGPWTVTPVMHVTGLADPLDLSAYLSVVKVGEVPNP